MPGGGFIAIGSSGHNYDYNAVMAIAFDGTFTTPTWAKNYVLHTASGAFPSMTSPNANNRCNTTGKAIASRSNGKFVIAGFNHNGNQYGAALTYLKGACYGN